MKKIAKAFLSFLLILMIAGVMLLIIALITGLIKISFGCPVECRSCTSCAVPGENCGFAYQPGCEPQAKVFFDFPGLK